MTTDDWTTPGVYEVVPGVHRIPLPLPSDGLRAVNVYVVVGTDGLFVVDSGWPIPESKDLLRSGLSELGADFTDVRRFLVTHVHRDHYAQAVHLRREFGIRVTLGEHERSSLEAAVRPGHPDMRESVALLRELGAQVSYHDPHVPLLSELALRSMPLDEAVSDSDLVVIVTAHAGVDHERVAKRARLVVDLRGVTRSYADANVVRL